MAEKKKKDTFAGVFEEITGVPLDEEKPTREKKEKAEEPVEETEKETEENEED